MAGHEPAASRWTLLLLCVIVALESAVLVGLAVAFGNEALTEATMPAADWFVAVFCLVVAGGAGAAGVALWRGRRWGRAPVMTVQVLLGVLAVGWLGVEVTWWAVATLAVAVVAAVTLLLPSVVGVTTGTRAERPGLGARSE